MGTSAGVSFEKLQNGKLEGNVIYGYWTNLNNKPIKRAYFGDTVRFNILLSPFVSTGDLLSLQFYEKDWMNDTRLGSAKKVSIKGSVVQYDFKIRGDWDNMIEGTGEKGEEIEAYCEVTYKNKAVDLAYQDNQVLKVYRKHKVLLVFFHGGPFGRGQIKGKSNDDTGYTGVIYNHVMKYAKSKGHETVGAIIAPAALEKYGVSTGYDFIIQNYRPGYEIIIYGYSYGGDNAVNLAERIDASNLPVDTMVIVDSTDGPLHQISVDTSVPDNVGYTLNIYQTKASGGSSKSGKNSDDPNSSEGSSSDGFSNSPASRGYPHTAEGRNKVDNINATSPDVTHGNIQQKKFDTIISIFKKRIDEYKYPK